MSWLKAWILVQVRALLDEDWNGSPGAEFRGGSLTKVAPRVSRPAGPSHEGISVGSLYDAGNEEQVRALEQFARNEEEKLEAELARRELVKGGDEPDWDHIKRRAEALKAEAELITYLRQERLTLLQDADGRFTLLPTRENDVRKR